MSGFLFYFSLLRPSEHNELLIRCICDPSRLVVQSSKTARVRDVFSWIWQKTDGWLGEEREMARGIRESCAKSKQKFDETFL